MTTAENDDTLDLLSISQTNLQDLTKGERVSEQQKRDIQAEIEQAEFYKSLACANNAPYVFFVDDKGTARLVRGCCNSWTCARCGHLRALHEYGNIVHGAKTIAASENALFFLTLTCRGRSMSLAEAENGYPKWTNRLLTNLRTETKRSGKLWAYAQVTERQKRGHPHSHLITTYCPDDVEDTKKGARLPNNTFAKHDCLYSARLENAAVRAGLGRMCDLSFINSPVAVAVYAAKYMFKDAVSVIWPTHWRRIRYSQNWPRMERKKPEIAFPLVRFSDWLKMERLGRIVHADDDVTRAAAAARSMTCVV